MIVGRGGGGGGEGLPDSWSRVICPPSSRSSMCLTLCSHAINLPAANFCRGNESQTKQRRTKKCDCYIWLEMYSNVKLDWTVQHFCVGSVYMGGSGQAGLARTHRVSFPFQNCCHRTISRNSSHFKLQNISKHLYESTQGQN